MAPSPLTITSDLRAFSPMAVYDVHLAKRAASVRVSPSQGSKPANSFNNLGFQVLFALIGLGMTMTALWFFFLAKNGGFRWRKGDWEDYKSTVLRRKGPDGRTLSNATKSTKLGGGSVVHGGSYGAESSVGYTDETGTSADFGEMREVEEGKSRRHFGLRGGDAKKHRARHEHDNNYKDPELREYRQERPARVGGINRVADGMYTDYSATEPSELGSNVSAQPLVKNKEKDPKDKKKEAKDKERRAKERMKKAKLAEKEAAKNAAAEAKAQKEAEKVAAAEAKAQKEAEKAAAKKERAEQKKAKKSRRAETEATPSEAPAMTEYTAPAMTEYTAPSEITAPSEAPGPSARRAPPSGAYSFTTGDDQTVYTGVYTDNQTRSAPSEVPESSYYSDYRPNAENSAYSRSRSRPRDSRSRPSSQSPRKQHRTSRQSNASDIFTQANGDVRGTISYPCHIPGLSSAGSVGVSESVSQVGGPSNGRRGRDVMAGYRRGGVRAVTRRDSLSDSDA